MCRAYRGQFLNVVASDGKALRGKASMNEPGVALAAYREAARLAIGNATIIECHEQTGISFTYPYMRLCLTVRRCRNSGIGHGLRLSYMPSIHGVRHDICQSSVLRLTWPLPAMQQGGRKPGTCSVALIPSIMLGIWLGYREIYLLGADHTWTKTLSVDDDNRVREYCFRRLGYGVICVGHIGVSF